MKKLLILLILNIYLYSSSSYSVSSNFYDYLQVIQKEIENAKYKSAITLIDELSYKRLSRYEKAILFKSSGYLYFEKRDNERAISEFEKSYQIYKSFKLNSDKNKKEFNQMIELISNIASLYQAQKEYRNSIKWYQVSIDAKPSSEVYYKLSILYYLKQEINKAISSVKNSIQIEKKLKYYDMLVSLYLENQTQSNIKKAINIQQKVIAKYTPKRRFFKLLSDLYLLQENQKLSLSIWQSAYELNLFENHSDYKRLAILYYNNRLPFQAGSILKQAIKYGKVKEDKKTLKLMSDFFVISKENSTK